MYATTSMSWMLHLHMLWTAGSTALGDPHLIFGYAPSIRFGLKSHCASGMILVTLETKHYYG